MELKIKQIIEAKDWFFVNHVDSKTVVVQHLAAWALMENGSVLGMITAGISSMHENKMARLVLIPSCDGGMYKHREELSDEERRVLSTTGIIRKQSKEELFSSADLV